MSEKEWERFFELLGKITNDGRSAVDKASEVEEKAKSYGAETDLEEFASWFDD